MSTMLIRRAAERGISQHAGMQSWHSFSFGRYYNAMHTGFGGLRVLNQDVLAPGAGIAMHAHANMQIISVVLSGALKHADDLGHAQTIRQGEIQLITAGSGIRHSEHNASANEAVEFLQIWLQPDRSNKQQQYHQSSYSQVAGWTKVLCANNDGDLPSSGANSNFWIARGSDAKQLKLGPDRMAWLQIVAGQLELADEVLHQGDGVGIRELENLDCKPSAEAIFLLIDMPLI